jgi:cyanate permease
MAALALTSSIIYPALGNWRRVFIGYGAFGIIISSIWALLGRGFPQGNQEEGVKTGRVQFRRDSVFKLLKYRNVWVIVGIGVAAFLTTHALSNWLPLVLELKGMSSARAGYATSIMALSGIIGSLAIPRSSYLVKSRRLLISAIFFVSGGSILLIGYGGGLLLWAGLLITGFLVRSLTPLLLLTLMEMPEVGSEYMGSVGGLYFSLGEIGGFLGPFMMGYIKDITGSFIYGFIALALVTEVSIIVLKFMKQPEKSVQ